MTYIKKECRINKKIEIEKYYDGRYGAPGMARQEKKKATPEDMARQNHWKRVKNLRRLMELNFCGGDMHVTLTCRKEDRPSPEEAPRVIREFRDRIAKEYKKRRWELKYIITCETGNKGAVHWHMIINNLQGTDGSTWDLIRKHWARGRPFFVPLEENREYEKLARYIVKETTDRIEDGKTLEKLSYMRSRNLKKPVERKKKKRANRWKNPPVPPRGYRLLEESLVNGFNKFTGLPYQKYTVVRVEEGGGG